MNMYFYTVTFEDGRVIDIHIRARNRKHAQQGVELRLIGVHNKIKEIDFNAVEDDHQ